MKVNLQELFKSKTEVKPTKDNKVVSGEVSNNTSTLELYKNRKSYKEQVNDQNLPIGQKNKDDKNLNNQLDMWYKRKTYLRYDEENRLIVPSVGSDKLIEIVSGFSLIDFVAEAANNFFNEYNVQRNGHPKSKLNNIKIVRAYEKRKPYDTHINEVYIQFFNEVLDPIKNTNKIKTFDDFLNLFYTWFIDKNIPITETGYYESENYNIYNTGFAFDYIKATTQEDKINIINDVRFPVVNYVAKTNGLRIDPNNPNRLIADIYSAPMLNKYVSKNFKNIKDIDSLPAAVYKKYFETINFSSDSEKVVITLISKIYSMYSKFVKKYPTYINFIKSENYKEKFVSSRLDRELPNKFLTNSRFFTNYYIKIRIKENNIQIDKEAVKGLTDTVYGLINLTSSDKFLKQTNNVQQLLVNAQPINYLESFILNKKVDGSKKNFLFFWDRATRKILEEEKQLSKFFASLVAINLGCKGVHIGPNGFYLPCSTPEEYSSLTTEK